MWLGSWSGIGSIIRFEIQNYFLIPNLSLSKNVLPVSLHQAVRTVLSGDHLKARLIRGGLGSAGIQAANRVLALALGIVLARSLGAEGYGVYAYAFAIMSLLMVVAEAGVPTLLMREIAASHRREEWGLLDGALRRGAQFVVLVGSGVAILGLLVLWWFVDSLPAPVIYTTALMLLVLPVSALCKTVANALRGLHRIVIGQAIDLLIRPLLVLMLIGFGFLFWPELREPYYAMAAQFVGAAIVLLIGVFSLRHLLPRVAKQTGPQYRSRDWLRSTLPFMLIGGAGIINNQADIIMLGWFLTPAEVGVYRVATQGALLVTFVLQASHALLGPYFSQCFAANQHDLLGQLYKKSSRVIFLLTVPIFAGLVLFSEPLISFVFGANFSDASSPLVILCIGYLLNIYFGPVGLVLQMTGYERFTAKVLWKTSAMNIALNLALIPLYGALGAASATAVSVVSYHAMLRYGMRRNLKI